MSVLYPLAIMNTASITSLVRTTLYRRSVSVYPANIETSEGVAGSRAEVRSVGAKDPVTPPANDIPGGETMKDRMRDE